MAALARSYCISLCAIHTLLQHIPSTLIMAHSVQAVLSALQVFSNASDKASLETANTWLQDFQHSVITFRVWSNVHRL
jgi:hypothetical protein